MNIVQKLAQRLFRIPPREIMVLPQAMSRETYNAMLVGMVGEKPRSATVDVLEVVAEESLFLAETCAGEIRDALYALAAAAHHDLAPQYLPEPILEKCLRARLAEVNFWRAMAK